VVVLFPSGVIGLAVPSMSYVVARTCGVDEPAAHKANSLVDRRFRFPAADRTTLPASNYQGRRTAEPGSDHPLRRGPVELQCVR
jgi:hypothetical protein